MEIEVVLLENKKQIAKYAGHQILSDAPLESGGDSSAPEPYDYFVASIGLCSGHYVREFCATRKIAYQGMKISTVMSKDANSDQRTFTVTVELPESFPPKYKKALLATLNKCTVKKTIQALPMFEFALC